MRKQPVFTQPVTIDSWEACSDKNIKSILSFDVVCTGSPVINMFTKKVNKQVLGILSLIRDDVVKQRRLPTPEDKHVSGHLLQSHCSR